MSLCRQVPLDCENSQAACAHKGFAARGKTSLGWLFGFNLHLRVNGYGDLLSVSPSTGSTDDRKPVPRFAHHLFGQLFTTKAISSTP